MAAQPTDNPVFWAEEFDLSALSYPEFLAYFFDRPVVADHDERYYLFRAGIDYFVASNPTMVVENLRAMCRTLSILTKVYSPEQIDQGLWAVFGAGISCEEYLFDPTVDIGLRVDCIESMYLPFKEVVTTMTGDAKASFYWMWWDMIFHTFWLRPDNNAFEFDYAGLSTDAKRILEAMFQTLCKILALDHRGCHWSAIHGLGHSHHPLAPATVQAYLDAHRNELSDEDVRWVEACRNGSIA